MLEIVFYFKKYYYTPVSLLIMRKISDYISGYIDGEGCFTVTFNARKKALLGWELRPSFSVSQNEDRSQTLNIIQEYFKCGSIRPSSKDKTVKYEVRNKEDLINKIIPHFEQYPLLSDKQKDFEVFKQICFMVYKKHHLTKKGFTKIVHLAYQMNGSGKRKRTAKKLISSLK